MGNLSSSGGVSNEYDYNYSSLSDEVLLLKIVPEFLKIHFVHNMICLQISEWYSTCSEVEELVSLPPGLSFTLPQYF